jgi:hypothetical protein
MNDESYLLSYNADRWKLTDVSKEHVAFIFTFDKQAKKQTIMKQAEIGTLFAFIRLHGVIYQKV